MADPQEQAATQLANIEAATGLTPANVAELVRGRRREARPDRHAPQDRTWTHPRQRQPARCPGPRLPAGGLASPDDLLAAQYAKGKAPLRPILDEILAMAQGLGDDAEVAIQKTAVSLRRNKQSP